MNRRQFLRFGGKLLAVAMLPRLVVAAPQPTKYGVDVCPYCSMTVADLRFAAQVVTVTGVVHTYDAIECLADHLSGHGPTPPEVAEVYLADYLASQREAVSYVDAAEAVILHHPRLRSPMGGGLAAFSSRADAEAFAKDRRLADARYLDWEQVIETGAGHPWVPDY